MSTVPTEIPQKNFLKKLYKLMENRKTLHMVMRRTQRENNLIEAHIEFGRFCTLHEYKYVDECVLDHLRH